MFVGFAFGGGVCLFYINGDDVICITIYEKLRAKSLSALQTAALNLTALLGASV